MLRNIVLWWTWQLGLRLDSVILKVLSDLNDSMILWLMFRVSPTATSVL